MAWVQFSVEDLNILCVLCLKLSLWWNM